MMSDSWVGPRRADREARELNLVLGQRLKERHDLRRREPSKPTSRPLLQDQTR